MKKYKFISLLLLMALITSGFIINRLSNELDERKSYYISIQKENNLQIKDLINLKDQLLEEKQALNDEIHELRGENYALEEENSLLAELKTEKLKNFAIEFNPYDLRVLSGASISQLDRLLYNTGLEGNGKSFKEAENEYGVNALALISIAAHESAWGTSDLAVNRNNLTGHAAYNGKVNESATGFDSFHDSIMTTAKLLSVDYLNENGKYFNGYSFKAVNTRYSVLDNGETNLNWSSINTQIARKLVRDANNLVAFNN